MRLYFSDLKTISKISLSNGPLLLKAHLKQIFIGKCVALKLISNLKHMTCTVKSILCFSIDRMYLLYMNILHMKSGTQLRYIP